MWEMHRGKYETSSKDGWKGGISNLSRSELNQDKNIGKPCIAPWQLPEIIILSPILHRAQPLDKLLGFPRDAKRDGW